MQASCIAFPQQGVTMAQMSIGAIAGAALLFAQPAAASDAVLGSEVTFTSYNDVVERCVRIAPMPGATYDQGDLDDEAELCGYDLYSHDIALCPKIWSTSPSIVLYGLEGSKFDGDRVGFQGKVCAGGKVAEYVADKELARLKFTMNQETTSASFSPAPLLYYHLSRYLGTQVKVPVAVWRTVDAQVLLDEVARTGANLTAGTEHLTQVHAAWQTIVNVIDDPDSYANEDAYGSSADLVTGDGSQLYGVLLDATGKSLGPVISGLEFAFWDDRLRHAFFMSTPAFRGLTADAPLAEAILVGRAGAQPPLAETMPTGASDFQIVVWMRELAETLLMDHILAQQDRPGNIDHKAYFYWVEGDQVLRSKAKGHEPGDGVVPAWAEPILRAVLNDNDAAGRIEYDNQAKIDGMLARLRHFDAGLYARLQELAADFTAEGPVWAWLSASLGLDPEQAEMIRANTVEAAQILQDSCTRGALRFDLDPEAFYLNGTVEPATLSCGG
jgi:hypothetical protein